MFSDKTNVQINNQRLMQVYKQGGQNDNKLNFKHSKSFSNRNCHNQQQPYSKDYLKAKRKAFDRYKKIYPIENKENLYEIGKTPCLGFYVMKGYRPSLNTLKEQKENENQIHSKSSEKIINHMLKKYLCRKEQANVQQMQPLPKIDQSFSLIPPVQRTSLNLKANKQSNRIYTDYDESRIFKPSITTEI